MSTPRRASVYANSYVSAKRQIQEAAEFLLRSNIVEFVENCPNEEEKHCKLFVKRMSYYFKLRRNNRLIEWQRGARNVPFWQ